MFLQTPSSHLNGHGCPSCAKVKKYDIDEFIGDPTGNGYQKLDKLRFDYFKKYINQPYDYILNDVLALEDVS